MSTTQALSLIFLGLTLFLGMAPATSAQEDEPEVPMALGLLPEGPYYLTRSNSKLQARIPFRWRADLDRDKIELTVAYVRFGQLDPRELAQASQATVETPAGMAPPTLVLALDFGDLVVNERFGTFELGLEGYEKAEEQDQQAIETEEGIVGASSKSRPEPLFTQKIELVRSASQLVQPSDFIVEQNRFLWWDFAPLPSAPMRLRPTAGPPPADIAIFQDGAAKIGDRDVSGELRLAAPARLLRLEGEPLAATIAEPFPLGDARGKLRIVSPDMEELEVGFTVRSRQHWFLIVILAILGLAAGFGVRVFLEAYIEKRRVLLQVETFQRRVAALRRRFAYREFSEQMDCLDSKIVDLIAKIRGATAKEEANTYALELDQLQTEIDAALQDAEGRRTGLQTRLAEILVVTRASWSLPQEIADKVTVTNKVLDEIGGSIARGELDSAEEPLSTAPGNLASNLRKLFPAWRKDLKDEFDKLRNTSPPLPASVTAQLQTAVEEVETALDQQLPPPTAEPMEVMRSLLTATHDTFQKASQLLSELSRATANVVEEVRIKLNGAGSNLPDQGAVAALDSLAQSLRTIEASAVLASLPDSTEVFHRQLVETLEGINSAIRNQLQDPSSVAQQIRGGNYLTAADVAVSEVSNQPVPLALKGKKAALPATPTAWELAGTSPRLDQALFVHRAADLPERIVIEPGRAGREIACARLLQSLLVGIGLLFVALILFKGSFVGTIEDWGKVFFWGFTTDIGVNVLLERATGLYPHQKPPA